MAKIVRRLLACGFLFLSTTGLSWCHVPECTPPDMALGDEFVLRLGEVIDESPHYSVEDCAAEFGFSPGAEIPYVVENWTDPNSSCRTALGLPTEPLNGYEWWMRDYPKPSNPTGPRTLELTLRGAKNGCPVLVSGGTGSYVGVPTPALGDPAAATFEIYFWTLGGGSAEESWGESVRWFFGEEYVGGEYSHCPVGCYAKFEAQIVRREDADGGE